MLEETTATIDDDATEWLRINNWGKLEFIIDGISDASTVVELQWVDDRDPTTTRAICTAVASPTTGQISNGLYTMDIAPRKRVRLIATTVGGSDSIYLRCTA